MPDPALSERPKIGRPARIDRAMIARAAYEVGLDHVTMKAVADHLGVSVPGLYHHVQGRSDLMQLGAEYSAAQLQLPVDHGQHWSVWLIEWATYSYDAFVAQPALLTQFLNGSLGIDRMVNNLDIVIGVLSRQGFGPSEAVEAYGLMTDCALGCAVAEIRESQFARAGHPLAAEYLRALAMRPDEDLPNLRALVAIGNDHKADLTERLLTVIVGIAARRGQRWRSILEIATAGG